MDIKQEEPIFRMMLQQILINQRQADYGMISYENGNVSFQAFKNHEETFQAILNKGLFDIYAAFSICGGEKWFWYSSSNIGANGRRTKNSLVFKCLNRDRAVRLKELRRSVGLIAEQLQKMAFETISKRRSDSKVG